MEDMEVTGSASFLQHLQPTQRKGQFSSRSIMLVHAHRLPDPLGNRDSLEGSHPNMSRPGTGKPGPALLSQTECNSGLLPAS